MYYETFDKDHINNFGDNKLKNELYKDDPNYIEIKRKNDKGNVKKIGLFRSATVIRNAVTGIKNFDHQVGSNSENLYFKINLSTVDYNGTVPLTLFFDNPKQCEDTLLTRVNPDISKKWYEKYDSCILEKVREENNR
jgi:hypothetical protein